MNYYHEPGDKSGGTFIHTNGQIEFDQVSNSFYLKKKRPEEDISIRKLGDKAQRLFLGPGGSREEVGGTMSRPREGVDNQQS